MSHPTDSSPAPGSPSPSVVPVDLRDYVRFSPDAATRVRVFATDVMTLDLWCVEPQQATDVLLYAEVDVTYTVIGGRSWFVTDQGEVGLDPMGAMLVPAGVAHGIDNRAPDPLIVLAAASPPDGGAPDEPLDESALAVRDEHEGLLARVRRRLRSGRG